MKETVCKLRASGPNECPKPLFVAMFDAISSSQKFALPVLAAISLVGCATAPEETSTIPAYVLQLRGNATFDVEGKARRPGFDAASNAWWLLGNGATVLLIPSSAPPGESGNAARCGVESGPVVFYLRTVAGGAGESRVSLLRIATPDHRIEVLGSAPDMVHISKTGVPASVETLRGGGLIQISRAGNRVKVVLSAGFLRQYAPHGAAVSWFDTSPASLPARSLTAPARPVSPEAPIPAPPVPAAARSAVDPAFDAVPPGRS
jgi:hypothetical protein